jgi:hypothetical protein
MSVICNRVSESCPKTCPHSKPHSPDKDTFYVGLDDGGSPQYVDGFCNEVEGPCEWVGGFKGGNCLCIHAEDERHKTIPALPGIGG